MCDRSLLNICFFILNNPPHLSLLNYVGSKLLTQQRVRTSFTPCVRLVVVFSQLVFVEIAGAFNSLRIFFYQLLLIAVEEEARCNSKIQKLNFNLLRFMVYCEQNTSLLML